MASEMRLLGRSLLIAALAAGAGVVWVAGQAPSRSRILVLPFDNLKREASIFWLGEASAVVLADDLNSLGAGAITREERRSAFERLQVPATAILSDATVIRIGQLVGASEVVTGTLQLEDDTLVVHARGIALETGRVTYDGIERGPMPALFETFERVASRIAPSGTDVRGHRPAAPAACRFRELHQRTPGGDARDRHQLSQRGLDDAARYDRARLALWDIYAEQGDHAKALAAVLPVATDSSWSRRARFLAALSYLNLNRFDEAFAGFDALAGVQPAAMALNNVGVVQLRRGPAPQTGQPAYYFKKAVEADSNDPDYFFNLGYAYWIARDPQAATYWLREAVRRNPADGDAHFVLGASLAAGGSGTEASRERELARRLSSKYEQWERRPPSDAVPRGLERVKDGVELPHARLVEASLATSDQRDLARFHLDRGRRLFEQERDREAIAELNRALYLAPYEAEAHLLVGRIHLRNNRVREAIDAFKISLWSLETAQAHVALGEAYLQAKNAELARAEVERAIMLDPASSDAKQLLGRIAAQ